MDDVRAVLILLPDAPLPKSDVSDADAIVYVAPEEPAEFASAAERVPSLLELGPPVYLSMPPLDSPTARDWLLAALRPGVYGVAARPPVSIDQLRYLEGLLEDAEQRNGIRPGLTAMAVGFEHPRALGIMADALSAMRDSSDRMTWVAFNHEELAGELGVAADSDTVRQAASQAVLTAAAFELPVVWGFTNSAREAAALGMRGCATIDPAELSELRAIFDRPTDATDPTADEEES